MEKKIKLYAYKIENDKLSSSYSDFLEKLIGKLSEETAIKATLYGN